MNRSKTLVAAALTALLALSVAPPAAAGGDIGFGIYFGHRHHHHYRPHKHYRRHSYPRYYRHDYYYRPWPRYGPVAPWTHSPYRKFRECTIRHGRRYCRWFDY